MSSLVRDFTFFAQIKLKHIFNPFSIKRSPKNVTQMRICVGESFQRPAVQWLANWLAGCCAGNRLWTKSNVVCKKWSKKWREKTRIISLSVSLVCRWEDDRKLLTWTVGIRMIRLLFASQEWKIKVNIVFCVAFRVHFGRSLIEAKHCVLRLLLAPFLPLFLSLLLSSLLFFFFFFWWNHVSLVGETSEGFTRWFVSIDASGRAKKMQMRRLSEFEFWIYDPNRRQSM